MQFDHTTVKLRYEAKTSIPTAVGTFEVLTFTESSDLCHLCLIYGELNRSHPTIVRIHSKCTTGDVFGSLRCDCQAQLNESMRIIVEAGKGVIIYLDQEGRGIGLVNKMKAYELQEYSLLDTVDANTALGHPVDARIYDAAIEILFHLKVRDVILLTNNPTKVTGLQNAGLTVRQTPLIAGIGHYNLDYLRSKKTRLGHIIPSELLSDPREKSDADTKSTR